MSFFSGIPIIGDIINAVSKGDETRQAIKRINDVGAIKLAQTKVDAQIHQASSDADSAGNLDAIALRNVGWKDEFLVIVITMPMILVFIPPMIPYVNAGFLALKNMPEYYQYMVGGVFIYVFGFKRILLKAIQGFIDAKFGKPKTTIIVQKDKKKVPPPPKHDSDSDDEWNDI